MSSDDYFQHPDRFPKNVSGPFYSLGVLTAEGKWCGQCLSCMAPESEAPTLLASLDDENSDTYFVRQPQSVHETEQACRAAEVCCVAAIRYGGRDPRVIRRLGAEYCDFEIGRSGELVIRAVRGRRWWQFWKKNT